MERPPTNEPNDERVLESHDVEVSGRNTQAQEGFERINCDAEPTHAVRIADDAENSSQAESIDESCENAADLVYNAKTPQTKSIEDDTELSDESIVPAPIIHSSPDFSRSNVIVEDTKIKTTKCTDDNVEKSTQVDIVEESRLNSLNLNKSMLDEYCASNAEAEHTSQLQVVNVETLQAKSIIEDAVSFKENFPQPQIVNIQTLNTEKIAVTSENVEHVTFAHTENYPKNSKDCEQIMDTVLNIKIESIQSEYIIEDVKDSEQDIFEAESIQFEQVLPDSTLCLIKNSDHSKERIVEAQNIKIESILYQCKKTAIQLESDIVEDLNQNTILVQNIKIEPFESENVFEDAEDPKKDSEKPELSRIERISREYFTQNTDDSGNNVFDVQNIKKEIDCELPTSGNEENSKLDTFKAELMEVEPDLPEYHPEDAEDFCPMQIKHFLEDDSLYESSVKMEDDHNEVTDFIDYCDDDSIDFKCNLCSRECISESGLIVHLRTSHNIKKNIIKSKYKCKMCSFETKSRSDSVLHLKDHIYKCQFCQKVLTGYRGLKSHQETFSFSRPIRCSDCKERFMCKGLLKNHRATPGIHIVKCDQCSYECHMKNMSDHLEKHLLWPYKCDYCNKLYKLENSLYNHQIECKAAHTKSSKSEKEISCRVCFRKFETDKKLNRHLRLMHTINRVTYRCKNCAFCTKDRDILRIHQRQHPYECEFCHQIFDRTSILKSHQEKRVKCFNCEEIFACQGLLQNHQAIPDIHSYKCDMCPFVTKSKAGLKRHLNMHLAEAYKCDKCHETFKFEELLERHKMLDCHLQESKAIENIETQPTEITNETNSLIKFIHHAEHSAVYECHECSFKTKFIRNLKIHKQREKHNKPYKCNFCEKKFMSHMRLSLHSKNIYNREQLQCKGCNKKFPCRALFRKHKKLSENCVKKEKEYYRLEKSKILANKNGINQNSHENPQIDHNNFFQISHETPMDIDSKFEEVNIPNLFVHQSYDETAATEQADQTRCDVCYLELDTAFELNQHLWEFHQLKQSKMYVCEQCGFQTKNKSLFKNHDGDHSFKCRFCQKVFLYEGVLERHMINKLTGKPYQCKLCDEPFPCVVLLAEHMRKKGHIHRLRVSCEICSHKCTRKAYLKHLATHKLSEFRRIELVKKRSLDRSSLTTYECEICGKSYKTKKPLENHRLICANTLVQMPFKIEPNIEYERDQIDIEIPCKTEKSIENNIDCFDFLEVSHDVMVKVEQDCNYEGDQTSDLANFEHQPDNKCIKCYSCCQEFSSETVLKQHMKEVHQTTEILEYVCQLCPFKTTDRTKFIVHIKEHIHQCEHCNKYFHRSSQLRKHTENITCKVCKEKFMCQSLLRSHKNLPNIHRYECDVCSWVGNRKQALKSHLLKKHKVSEYKCGLCLKMFKSNELLERHKMNECQTTDVLPEVRDTIQSDINLEIEQESINSNRRPSQEDTNIMRQIKTENINEFETKSNSAVDIHGNLPSEQALTYNCSEYSVETKFSSNLKMCIKRNKDKMEYICKLCKKKFKVHKGLKKHTMNINTGEALKCKKCNEPFQCRKILNEHKKTCNYHKVKVKCDLCLQWCTRKSYLKHMAKHLISNTQSTVSSCNGVIENFRNSPSYHKIQSNESIEDLKRGQKRGTSSISPNTETCCDPLELIDEKRMKFEPDLNIVQEIPSLFNVDHESDDDTPLSEWTNITITKTHERNTEYKCDSCDKIYKFKKCFYKHIRICTNSLA